MQLAVNEVDGQIVEITEKEYEDYISFSCITDSLIDAINMAVEVKASYVVRGMEIDVDYLQSQINKLKEMTCTQ